MYLDYWGFKLFPFENVPDPRFLYLSQSHEEALSRLLYAARMGKGGAMLSGEVGCGKTTLAKACIQELSGEKFDMALVVNPRLEPVEFLQEVLYRQHGCSGFKSEMLAFSERKDDEKRQGRAGNPASHR